MRHGQRKSPLRSLRSVLLWRVILERARQRSLADANAAVV
jgi:hypothetical protein